MKKFLLSCFLAVGGMFLIAPIETSLAADANGVVGFEILAPSTAKVNEAIDVTVRAIDKDKKTVASYRGSIIFISDTFGDTVPSPGKAISFTAEDAGQKKFSKGVIFRSTGKQKIYVADVDNSSDVIGETTVTVSPSDSVTASSSGEVVTVVTPVKDSKITTDTVAVSGQTKKNSKVVYLLNGTDVGSSITDDTGLFTKTLTGITQENNILKVQLLDGTNSVIGQSDEIKFGRVIETAGFYNLVVSPGTTVEAGSPITFTVEGDAGMPNASVLLDGTLIALKETTTGKYSANTVAPAKEWSYTLDVNMVSSLGKTIEKKWAATLTVTAKAVVAPKFTNVKVVTVGNKATFTFSVTDAPADLSKFKIAYGESADSLSKEVVTYTTDKIGSGGVYTWYISGLDPKNYTFKIFGMKADGSLIPNFVSEPIMATVGTVSCSIGNVGDIQVTKTDNKSILSWKALSGAVSYNVYMLNAAGDQTLVQNVTTPSYTIHIASGSVRYDDFVVKALCAPGKESADMSKASRVQTGPGAIALLVILSGIIAAVVLRKRSFS